MADLTPKVITELPELTSIPDTAAFAVSSGGSSRRTLWSTIKSAFVRRTVTGDAYMGADYTQGYVIMFWQNNADNTQRYGLVVSKTFIGLWDSNANNWVWRTPLMSQALGAWQIEQGGTGANNAADARASLSATAEFNMPTQTNAGSTKQNLTNILIAVRDRMVSENVGTCVFRCIITGATVFSGYAAIWSGGNVVSGMAIGAETAFRFRIAVNSDIVAIAQLNETVI